MSRVTYRMWHVTYEWVMWNRGAVWIQCGPWGLSHKHRAHLSTWTSPQTQSGYTAMDYKSETRWGPSQSVLDLTVWTHDTEIPYITCMTDKHRNLVRAYLLLSPGWWWFRDACLNCNSKLRVYSQPVKKKLSKMCMDPLPQNRGKFCWDGLRRHIKSRGWRQNWQSVHEQSSQL